MPYVATYVGDPEANILTWGEVSGLYSTPAEILTALRLYHPNSLVTTDEQNRLVYYNTDYSLQDSFGNYIGPVMNINTTGIPPIVTSKEVNQFIVTLSCPALYGVDDTKGYVDRAVTVGIYYRGHKEDPIDHNGWMVLDDKYTISAQSPSEVIRYVTSPALPMNKYDILVVRRTESHYGDFKIRDEVVVKEITEIIHTQLRYNHTAMLGLKIRATDQLSGQLPTVTSLVKGIKVSVPSNQMSVIRYSGKEYQGSAVQAAYATWNGQLGATKVWSDNPVWCLYDLLTNDRYGMADYYKIDESKRGLMLANFYIMARYCDEQITYKDAFGVYHTRPRFSLNIVLDQSKSATDWIATIAAVMRASCFYTEGVFWIEIDRPKYMSQIFNMTNIKEYSQSGTSFRGIPNTFEVQYINPDAEYEVDVFRVESQEIVDNPQLEERKKALMLLGVTNFDQAKSIAKFAMLAGQYRTKIVTFKTGTHGLRSMVSDVIGIQHDVPVRDIGGWGGKVTSYDAVNNRVSLSAPINPITNGMPYFFSYTNKGGAPVEVIIAGGWDGASLNTIWNKTDYTTIQLISVPTQLPVVGDTFVVTKGADSDPGAGVTYKSTVSPYKVVSIKRDTDEFCEITAVEYAEQIYSMCDDTSSLGGFTTPNYALIINPNRESVQGVRATANIYQDSGLNYKVGVKVIYSAPSNNTFWKSCNLNYAKVGSTNYKTIDNNISGIFEIPEITEPGDYQFVITSNYSQGKQSVVDALSDSARHPYTQLTVDLFVPNDTALQGVIGLTVTNQANDGTFLGKDCQFTWKAPNVIKAAVGTTAGSGTAGTEKDSSWLGHYEVTIKNIDGSIRRTTNIYVPSYIYTHELNHQDLPRVARNFIIEVKVYDKLGRASTVKSLEVNNPKPAKIIAL